MRDHVLTVTSEIFRGSGGTWREVFRSIGLILHHTVQYFFLRLVINVWQHDGCLPVLRTKDASHESSREEPSPARSCILSQHASSHYVHEHRSQPRTRFPESSLGRERVGEMPSAAICPISNFSHAFRYSRMHEGNCSCPCLRLIDQSRACNRSRRSPHVNSFATGAGRARFPSSCKQNNHNFCGRVGYRPPCLLLLLMKRPSAFHESVKVWVLSVFRPTGSWRQSTPFGMYNVGTSIRVSKFVSRHVFLSSPSITSADVRAAIAFHC